MWYSFILKLLPIEGIKLTQNERQTKFWFSSCEPCRSRYNVVWMIVFFKGDKMYVFELVQAVQSIQGAVRASSLQSMKLERKFGNTNNPIIKSLKVQLRENTDSLLECLNSIQNQTVDIEQ